MAYVPRAGGIRPGDGHEDSLPSRSGQVGRASTFSGTPAGSVSGSSAGSSSATASGGRASGGALRWRANSEPSARHRQQHEQAHDRDCRERRPGADRRSGARAVLTHGAVQRARGGPNELHLRVQVVPPRGSCGRVGREPRSSLVPHRLRDGVRHVGPLRPVHRRRLIPRRRRRCNRLRRSGVVRAGPTPARSPPLGRSPLPGQGPRTRPEPGQARQPREAATGSATGPEWDPSCGAGAA